MTNPQPAAFVLLLPALPGTWLAARAITRPLALDRAVAGLVTPAVAVALWMVTVAPVARLASSLETGMWVATIALAIAGYGAAWRTRNERPPAAGAAAARQPSPWMGWTALLVALPMTVVAFHTDLYDETVPNGHLSLVAQLQNDYFPPRNQILPEDALRYHYGFDLVCAGLTAVTRAPVPAAIDLVMAFCLAWSWCLVWVLGDRLGGRGAGGWTALATLLGGGGAFLLGTGGLGGSAVYGGQSLNPPVLAYFLQKPFALGIPLAVAVLLVALEAAPARRGRGVVLALLLGALSLAHAVLFVTLLATLTFAEAVAGRRWRFLWTFAAAVLLAAALGGMLFTPPPAGAGLGLEARVWLLVHGPGAVLAWHLLSFGALLPLGLVGFRFLRRFRLVLALLLGGCLLVPNVIRYEHTWDIVKFSTVAALVLGVLSGLTLSRLAARRGWTTRAALAAAVIALTATSTVFVTVHLGAVLAELGAGPHTLHRDDAAAIAWLRRHAAPGEVVYHDPQDNEAYAQHGLHTVAPLYDGFLKAFGVSTERLIERKRLLRTLPDSPRPYLAQGIRWLVVEPEDRPLSGYLEAWREDGHAELAATFGALRIYRLPRPSPGD